MTVAVVLKFLKDHWQKIGAAALIGVAVIGATTFYSSWRMRGAKIELLETEKSTVEFKLESTSAQFMAVSKQLIAQQSMVELWKEKHGALSSRHREAMVLAGVEAERIAANASNSSSAASEAIRRAETCEEQVTALVEAMRGFQP